MKTRIIGRLIVFGAVFTAAVCWGLGRVLFRSINDQLLAAICGAAVLSLVVFGLCCVGLARTWVFLVIGIAVVAWASASLRARLGKWVYRPPVVFWVPFVFYGVVYLSNSLAPEFSPDGAAYHLGLVATYFRQHGFERLTTNMYGNLSQGMEMLFLFAFAFGRHASAATLHCLFLIALPLLMFSYGSRIGHARAGVCAGMLVFLSPLVGIDGVSAYNDVALATVAFAMFSLIEIWREEADARLLIPIGLLAGFCFSIKYTGIVALVYAVIAVRKRVPVVAASAMALPWLLKNYLWLGNPVSPFFNRVFPNPYVHVSFEESYRHYLSSFAVPSLWKVAVTGELGGQIGPLFLLAPIALLSLRSRVGRRCLLAALIFLLPYPTNVGARFLIPALPFIALAIGLVLEFSQALVVIVVLAAGVLAWPRVIDRYRAPAGGWQIVTVPWKAALGIIPAEKWLERNPGYRLAEVINRNVLSDKRVWSTTPLAEAYITPQVLVNYYSAEGEEIQDILLTGFNTDLQPLWNWRFTFAPRSLGHVRVVQTATSKDDIWSIGEARFLHGGAEVNPVHADARPFPWDIVLAFDRNPVTRWRSWESIHPGMYAEFQFPAPVMLDRVDLYCSHDQWKVEMRLDGLDAKVEKREVPPVADLRRLATRTIRGRGIDYLLVGGDYQAASDIAADPARWGLREVGAEWYARLYKIE